MNPGVRPHKRLSRKKQVFFWAVILAIPLVVVEGALRVRLSYQLGSSMLFYGTSLNREKMNGDADTGSMNHRGDYFKYHPHQKRFTRDKVTGELIRTTINSHGFRGREFNMHKDPGVIRVVTLGASSTFGFSDADDETYPYRLEKLLNGAAPPGEHFEVINLGIPHLRSGEILALFEAEALPLEPDVVTFYEGINDCWLSRVRVDKVKPRPTKLRQKLSSVHPLRRSFRWLRDHSVTVFVADGMVRRQKEVTFDEHEVEAHIEGKSEAYLANVEAIHKECRERHIKFIVASQQAKSLLVDKHDIKGVTYADELGMVRHKLALEGGVDQWELFFLTHAVLMRDLAEWVRANNVPYVDVIHALDQRRDCLLSWVHLSPEGNDIVAEALAGEIFLEVAHN